MWIIQVVSIGDEITRAYGLKERPRVDETRFYKKFSTYRENRCALISTAWAGSSSTNSSAAIVTLSWKDKVTRVPLNTKITLHALSFASSLPEH